MELHPDFRKSGCAVVGVSPDTAESHRRFAEKLEVPSVAERSAHDLTEKCGFGERKLYGKEYMGGDPVHRDRDARGDCRPGFPR